MPASGLESQGQTLWVVLALGAPGGGWGREAQRLEHASLKPRCSRASPLQGGNPHSSDRSPPVLSVLPELPGPQEGAVRTATGRVGVTPLRARLLGHGRPLVAARGQRECRGPCKAQRAPCTSSSRGSGRAGGRIGRHHSAHARDSSGPPGASVRPGATYALGPSRGAKAEVQELWRPRGGQGDGRPAPWGRRLAGCRPGEGERRLGL